MSTFEVKVRKVKIEPHPNADKLELAVVGDYRSIVGKGQFKDNQLVAYIPEAAILPDWLIEEMNLVGKLAGKNKNRVKAMKLRKILSQGLCYDMKDFPIQDRMDHYPEGTDVQEKLGIFKWEPPIPSSMSGEVCNVFGHTVKYDIENIKNHPDIIQDGEEVIMTEKLHGCVHPNTLIMLPNGEERAIGEILKDSSIMAVLSYDVVTNMYVRKEITGRSRRPNTEGKRWMKLTIESGRSIVITEDHPIFSRDRGGYVEAKNIREGEDIESPIDH